VQAVCDRVALFSKGKVAVEGTVRELAARVLGGGYTLQVESSADAQAGDTLANLLGGIDGVRGVSAEGAGRWRVLAERDVRDAVARALVAAGRPLLRLASVEPSLDEIYRRWFEGMENAGGAHAPA
jgi:ABC-2 type transport system ATP-binding protein